VTTATLSPELVGAADELRATFPDATVTLTTDDQGGAWIVIDPIDLGERWEPIRSWLGFHVAATYPYADIYPHFIPESCRLADGGGLPPAVSTGASMPGLEGTCLQISRKSHRWDPTRDTAAIKALKVSDWLAGR
jgi:hypothetical protein